MDYSEFHRNKILDVPRLELADQAELLQVIHDNTDKTAAEQAYEPYAKRDEILTGIYEHIECYEQNAQPDALIAHDILVNSSMRLAQFVIGKYITSLEQVDSDDLLQEGWLALSLATWKYNPDRGAAYSTYVVPRIRSRVERVLTAYNGRLRTTEHLENAVRATRRHLPELTPGRSGSKTSRNQISSLVGSTSLARSVENYEASFRHIASLDEGFGRQHVDYFDNDGQPTTGPLNRNITDQLVSNTCNEMEEELDWALDTLDYADFLLDSDILDDREREVLRLRFGFYGDSPMTLEEVGPLFGVTRERIRQIESKAMAKLRAYGPARYTGPTWRQSDNRDGLTQPKRDAFESIRNRQEVHHAWGEFKDMLMEECGISETRVVSAVKQALGKDLHARPVMRNGVYTVPVPPDVRDEGIRNAILEVITNTLGAENRKQDRIEQFLSSIGFSRNTK